MARPSATSSSCSRTTFDPAGLEERVGALETQMQEPGIWDDQERAAKVSADHASANGKLESFRKLESELDDLEALEDLAAEDESMAGELEDTRWVVQSR